MTKRWLYVIGLFLLIFLAFGAISMAQSQNTPPSDLYFRTGTNFENAADVDFVFSF